MAVMILFSVLAVTAINEEAGKETEVQTTTQAATQQQTGKKVTVLQAVPEETPESEIHSRDWDDEDSYRLLKIAMAEAEGESVEGKALVMLVVLNRVWDNSFPDTIEGVIFQKNQFSPVKEGGRYWTTEPDEGCYKALELVTSGWDESQGALYFESTGKAGWHSRNLEFLFQVGGHKFYK